MWTRERVLINSTLLAFNGRLGLRLVVLALLVSTWFLLFYGGLGLP
jgi:hypothetical protein